MNNADHVMLPAPATYEEAEAILRKLSQTAAESRWGEFSHEDAETLLRSFAPTHESDGTSRSVLVSPVQEPRPAGAAEPAELADEPSTLPHLSEATLLDVLETAPDAVVVIDTRGAIVLVNAQTEIMFGYTRQEMIGKKVEILVPIRNQAGHVAQRRGYFNAPHVRAMGAAGKPLFGLRKDGREFPVEISLSPLKTDAGLLVTSVIRDVTERNRHEAELAKAEARYRSLVEEIPAVTFVAPFDEGVGELYVSPQIVNMLGFTQEEWLNDPVLWHRQLHREDRERWHQEFARTCATAQPFRSEYRFLARDGRTVWVHGEAKVVRDKQGRPMFLQGVAFDITERKRAEEELRQVNRTLNERVADRTEALKRSNDALAQYGNRVAHEMKKPVRRLNDVLNGPVDKSKPSDPPEVRLAKIKAIAVDTENLIKEMLRVALVSQEAKKFAATNCDALVRQVCAEWKNELDGIGAKVFIHSLPVVHGHAESLKAVFSNLLDNAIKYRCESPLEIRVSTSQSNNAWLFSIQDNGMGIPKFSRYVDESDPKNNNHENIFKLFERHHTSGSAGQIAGHGIGLAYCRQVIEHHGGKIWVESQEGKGSTFFFMLPAAADAANSERA